MSNATPAELLQSHAVRYVRKCRPVNNGERNNGALSVAGHLRSFVTVSGERLSEADIVNHTLAWNASLAEPLPEHEVITTAKSAIHNGTPRADKIVKPHTPQGPMSQQIGETASEPSPVLPSEWRDPLPLELAQVEPMPPNLLPGTLGEMAEAVSLATETPRELASTFIIAVAAIAAQRIWRVEVEPGYFEALCIYNAVFLESGMRKTGVVEHLARPLKDMEFRMMKDAEVIIKRATSQHETTTEIIKGKRRELASKNVTQDAANRLRGEIDSLEESLPAIPAIPRLTTEDVTVERLGAMMAENGERMGILSDEAGVFDGIVGKYRQAGTGPNMDLYLKAWSASAVRVDRGSRPAVVMQSPHLSMAVTPQPSVIAALSKQKELRGRGLLARWFGLIRPRCTLGYRSLEPRAVPVRTAAAYADAMVAILGRGQGVQPDEPHTIEFSPEAYQLWKAFQRSTEIAMRPGNRLEHLADWGAKLPGQVARIAALFHIMLFAYQQPHEFQIDADTMSRAIRLAHWATGHAVNFFGSLGVDSRIELACRIVDWLQRKSIESFSQRDCWQGVRGNNSVIQSSDDLPPALTLLVEYGYLMPDAAPEKIGPGRNPSPRWIVNPKVHDEPTRPDIHSGDSGKPIRHRQQENGSGDSGQDRLIRGFEVSSLSKEIDSPQPIYTETGSHNTHKRTEDPYRKKAQAFIAGLGVNGRADDLMAFFDARIAAGKSGPYAFGELQMRAKGGAS